MFYIPINDKFVIKDSESWYINSEIYDEFFFLPKSDRKEVKVLIQMTSYLIYIYTALCGINIKNFFLSSHSSRQRQPLNLFVFHLHKDKTIKIYDESENEDITKKNKKLLFNLYCKSGKYWKSFCFIWCCMKHYLKDYPTRLSNDQKTNNRKKKRKGETDKRIRISEIQYQAYIV